MKLPQHLLDFWVHRLTSCGFIRTSFAFVNLECDTQRCALGALLPKENPREALVDLNNLINLKLNCESYTFREYGEEESKKIFLVTFNDRCAQTLEEVAEHLKYHQDTDLFEFTEQQLSELDYFRKLAIANGEYPISGLEAR